MIIQVERSECIEVNWDGEAFKNMKRLKVLILENAKFSHAPKCLPNSLRVLRWITYPSSSLPSGFRPKDLAEFNVQKSHFNSLETISKIMPNVSVLNFQDCEYIRKIPNLSCLSNLKELWLDDCEKLTEIDDSVGQLAKLETLSVDRCEQLETFPRELNTPSLVCLNLDYCVKLNYFPEIVTRDMEISALSLHAIGISQLPPSIENLTQLTKIYIASPVSIDDKMRGGRVGSERLPSSTCLLPKLQHIGISGYQDVLMEVGSIRCPSIQHLEITTCEISNENLGIYLTSFSNVHTLDLRGSKFTILPSCIEDCQNLYKLVLNGCKHLIHVEKVPPSIQILKAAGCTSLSSESRKLLLSKELLAYALPINNVRSGFLCVPGGSIPKWFDHCSKGRSISFWFRDPPFPILCICAIFKPATYFGLHIRASVFINDKMALEHDIPSFNWILKEDNIIVGYLWDSKLDELFEADQWTHVKIDLASVSPPRCLSFEYVDPDAKEIGIYVIQR